MPTPPTSSHAARDEGGPSASAGHAAGAGREAGSEHGTTQLLRGARRAFVLALACMAILAPALLAVARWPQWWTWIAPEQTPMTWLQSVALMLAAAGSAVIFLVLRLHGHPARSARAWPILTVGFAALALDERFAVHERIRDGLLAPRDISVPFLPWIAPGDFLILGVALVGLLLLPMVLRAVRVDPGARVALLVGVALSVLTVGVDSIDPSTWTVQEERLQQTLEEVLELWAGLCFLAAVGLRLTSALDDAGLAPVS